MPHEWLPANISPLRTACHNYIVHAVLYDQLSAMLPGDPYTLQLLEDGTLMISMPAAEDMEISVICVRQEAAE